MSTDETESTADKWKEKSEAYTDSINAHIKDAGAAWKAMKRKKGVNVENVKFRGLEHPWYAVWFAVLARLCEEFDTLLPCPQHWVEHVVLDQDENAIDKWLIPDFMIIRVARIRGRHDRIRILTKVGLILEIKCSPGDECTPEEVIALLGAARTYMMPQAQAFFAGLSGKANDKRVVGMFAVGEYWSWQVFKLADLGLKPLSKNADPTYRGSEEPEAPPEQIPFRHYKLGTDESDEAMREMVEEIFKLPGSEIFRDRR